MQCPVCYRELSPNTNRCPYCNYNQKYTEFIDSTEKDAWMSKAIVPYRINYINTFLDKNLDTDSESNEEVQEYLSYFTEKWLCESIFEIEFIKKISQDNLTSI